MLPSRAGGSGGRCRGAAVNSSDRLHASHQLAAHLRVSETLGHVTPLAGTGVRGQVSQQGGECDSDSGDSDCAGHCDSYSVRRMTGGGGGCGWGVTVTGVSVECMTEAVASESIHN